MKMKKYFCTLLDGAVRAMAYEQSPQAVIAGMKVA